MMIPPSETPPWTKKKQKTQCQLQAAYAFKLKAYPSFVLILYLSDTFLPANSGCCCCCCCVGATCSCHCGCRLCEREGPIGKLGYWVMIQSEAIAIATVAITATATIASICFLCRFVSAPTGCQQSELVDTFLATVCRLLLAAAVVAAAFLCFCCNLYNTTAKCNRLRRVQQRLSITSRI